VCDFLSALEAEKPAGFIGASSFRTGPAPWLPGPAYLDWYRIGGFADLEALNEGAVTASRKAPHVAVAALAAGGAGGIYRHKSGPKMSALQSSRTGSASPGHALRRAVRAPRGAARLALDAPDGARPVSGVALFAPARAELPFPSLPMAIETVGPIDFTGPLRSGATPASLRPPRHRTPTIRGGSMRRNLRSNLAKLILLGTVALTGSEALAQASPDRR